MQCMCFTSKQTEVLVAGRQNSMYVVDIVKGEVVKEVQCSRGLPARYKLTDTSSFPRSTTTPYSEVAATSTAPPSLAPSTSWTLSLTRSSRHGRPTRP